MIENIKIKSHDVYIERKDNKGGSLYIGEGIQFKTIDDEGSSGQANIISLNTWMSSSKLSMLDDSFEIHGVDSDCVKTFNLNLTPSFGVSLFGTNINLTGNNTVSLNVTGSNSSSGILVDSGNVSLNVTGSNSNAKIYLNNNTEIVLNCASSSNKNYVNGELWDKGFSLNCTDSAIDGIDIGYHGSSSNTWMLINSPSKNSAGINLHSTKKAILLESGETAVCLNTTGLSISANSIQINNSYYGINNSIYITNNGRPPKQPAYKEYSSNFFNTSYLYASQWSSISVTTQSAPETRYVLNQDYIDIYLSSNHEIITDGYKTLYATLRIEFTTRGNSYETTGILTKSSTESTVFRLTVSDWGTFNATSINSYAVGAVYSIKIYTAKTNPDQVSIHQSYKITPDMYGAIILNEGLGSTNLSYYPNVINQLDINKECITPQASVSLNAGEIIEIIPLSSSSNYIQVTQSNNAVAIFGSYNYCSFSSPIYAYFQHSAADEGIIAINKLYFITMNGNIYHTTLNSANAVLLKFRSSSTGTNPVYNIVKR